MAKLTQSEKEFKNSIEFLNKYLGNLKKITRTINDKKRNTILGAKGFDVLTNQTYINIDRIITERSAHAYSYTITNDEYFYNEVVKCNEDLKNLLGIV